MDATAVTPKVIAARVIDPREPRLFSKPKKSDPAEFLAISCACESCPLLAQNQCVMRRILAACCPYGRRLDETGPTRRHAKFGEWIREKKNLYPGVGWNLDAPPTKLAFIGDYVFLPYSHADMCKRVPFLRHSAVFIGGIDFIKRENWTLENVLALIDFRHQALMGGEITSYQRDSVPLFIEHIRELDSEMWRQLIAARPQYDKAPNYVGRKAIVSTLAHPITIPPYDDRYPVEWQWNGKTLKTTSQHAYGSTWGHIKPESLAIEIIPATDAAVVVRDNAWVTKDTVFVD